MPHRNAGYVIKIVPFIVLFHAACAPVQPVPPAPPPDEKPAEIVLPPSNSIGNLVRIRAQLLPYKRGVQHSHGRPATCANCMVNVSIRSVGLTTDIDPLVGPPRFRIIGWVTNNDPTDIESKYRLKPQTDYLMWVDAAPLNQARTSRTRWGLVELPRGATGVTRVDTIGYVVRCRDAHRVRSTVSDADFKECETSHAVPAVTQRGIFSVASFGAPASPSRSNRYVVERGWFDCGGYCCSGTDVNR